MKNGQYELQKSPAAIREQLRVSEIVQFLVSLAKLHENDKVGNAGLSEGLRSVAQALRPYADCLVMELPDAIKGRMSSTGRLNTGSAKAKSQQQLPPTLESLGQEGIETILNDEGYTKKQIAELGAQRFGISRSKLERLRKEDARGSVRAALEHERSLDAISMEARRGG